MDYSVLDKDFKQELSIYKQNKRQPVTLWDTSIGTLGPEYIIRDLMDLYNIPRVIINMPMALEPP